MPPNLKTTSSNLTLKRKAIYEKHYQHNLPRSNQLGRNDSPVSSESCQQVQLLEVTMDIELVAIQIIVFGTIILAYMAEEFFK